MHTSRGERSDKGSAFLLTASFTSFSPTPGLDVILFTAGSLGGGGSGDLILPPPLGGGARNLLALSELMVPPDKPAAESIPVPLDGLFLTLIRIVSPSYKSIHSENSCFLEAINQQFRKTRAANQEN